jgi:PhoD-like phosphatase
MDGARVSRRELLVAGVAAGAALSRSPSALAAVGVQWQRTIDFSRFGPGDRWPGWVCPGVANLRRSGGLGLLEAGSDVFPCDPRPVAFALDQRFRDGEIEAAIEKAGAGAGVVLRRVEPRSYYAALYDDEQAALVLLRRFPAGVQELARLPVPRPTGPFRLTFSASGTRPTVLKASFDVGVPLEISVRDASPALQRAGDPGVLATARTLFPSEGPAPLPALGNLHLLPYGVQQGEAFIQSPAGQQVVGEIRERSTGAFSQITVRANEGPRPTAPSAIAAASTVPLAGGATLRVAADVPARVEMEVSSDPAFHHSRRLPARATNAFGGMSVDAANLRSHGRVFWRARLKRRGVETVGPTRSFRVLPPAGSSQRTTIAIAACAAQFGPIFDQLNKRHPDVFVWQGDLNYPDTVGPLAQTIPGYAGIWRDFLANPRMSPIFERSLFAPQRDDHDYGVQDANSTDLVPWGITPWQELMERRLYYRFSAGLADVWVLDQRRHKSDPKAPDTAAKTLLGKTQREWFLRTLKASHAPFKVVCSPCTLAGVGANRSDGSWAAGFTAERDLVLAHVRKHVSGRTIFVTGDTHWTMVYDTRGLFEARPCPFDIPTPNDITLVSPQAAEDARGKPGVAYADDEHGHFAFLTVGGHAGRAHLDLSMVRDDGAVPFRRRFEQRLRPQLGSA